MSNMERTKSCVKFYTWMNKRWCALDLITGSIESKRHKARFVYFRNGRLHALSRDRALRGLRALAAGRPSTIRDGPPLPERRVDSFKTDKQELLPKTGGCRCCRGDRLGFHMRRETGAQTEDCSRGLNNNHTEASSVIPTEDVARTSTAQTEPKVTNITDVESPERDKTPVKDVKGSDKIKRPARSIKNTVKKKKKKPPTPIESTTDESDETVETKNSSEVRELTINENDVVVLRNFLIGTKEGFDVTKFDCDEKYKLLFFYQINPLVFIERCEDLERRLREPSKDYFASRLGLRSVSEVSSQTRQSPRLKAFNVNQFSKKEGDLVINNKPGSSGRPITKSRENLEKLSKGKMSRSQSSKLGKHVKTSNKERNLRPQVSKREIDIEKSKKRRNSLYESSESAENLERLNRNRSLRSQSSESENFERSNKERSSLSDISKRKERTSGLQSKREVNVGASKKDRNSRTNRKPLASRDTNQNSSKASSSKAKKPTRNGDQRSVVSTQFREYSALEDQAMVAWVSSGSRARMVNGNRLWRELEEQYERLTGVARTWQSLRNRYLRNILPSLGKMALPSAHASRLRAAAATGELKQKRLPRRNSIFDRDRPVKGASSRGPPSPPPRTPSPSSPPSTATPAPSPSPSVYEFSGDGSSDSSSSKPPKKKLRSSTHRSPAQASKAPLRYSEVLRHFHDKRKPPSECSPRLNPRPRREGAGLRKLFNPNVLM